MSCNDNNSSNPAIMRNRAGGEQPNSPFPDSNHLDQTRCFNEQILVAVEATGTLWNCATWAADFSKGYNVDVIEGP